MSSQTIEVVAGALIKGDQVLLAQRPPGKHMAGYWEFPGGKAEAGEAFSAALRRELQEELAVTIESFHPLMRLQHQYPDRTVRLHLYRVESWSGEPRGAEGQEVAWHSVHDLSAVDLLPADEPFVRALQLPPCMAITPDDYLVDDALGQASFAAEKHYGLTLRGGWLANLSSQELAKLLRGVVTKNPQAYLNLGFASIPELKLYAEVALDQGVAGLHLPNAYWPIFSRDLQALKKQQSFWLSTSCHNLTELSEGSTADFLLAAPVLHSEKQLPLLGWNGIYEFTSAVAQPIYALGGCGASDLDKARAAGAIGVAGISAFAEA